MKIIGLLLIFFGIAIGMYAFAMDTTVDVDHAFDLKRVNNIGLLNEKQNILFVSGVLCIMGSIFVAGAYKSRTDWPVQNFSQQSLAEQTS